MQDTFRYRVAQVLSGDYPARENVPICDTPELIQQVGFSGKKIVMEQNKLRLCLAPEASASGKENHHELPIDFVDNLPQYVQNPTMILSSLSHPNDSVVIVTDCKDKKDRPIIISLRDEGKRGVVDGEVVTYDKLTSTYGRKGFADFLERSIKANGANNGLLYYNEKKSRDLAVSAGLHLPRVLANHDPNVIIRRYNDNVNTLSQNNLDFSPDGYGQTLYRPDKRPFAYSDKDGRQKTFDYTETPSGEVVLRSTAATFSDGRSEITEYGDNGAITSIERKDEQGRTTYKYSSNGLTFYAETHEESREYYDGKERFQNRYSDYSEPLYKSVHEKTRECKDGRYGFHDEAKESWHEYDERGNATLVKYNEYGDNDRLYHAAEDRFEYDRYDNVVLNTDREGGVYRTEYYSPKEVREYFCYTIDDYDAGVRDYDTVRSKISKRPDGSICKEQYELDGCYTRVEFSSDGKITCFTDKDGKSYDGSAAQKAYLKSCGVKAPTFAEVAAATKTLHPSGQSGKNNKSSGSGSSGR